MPTHSQSQLILAAAVIHHHRCKNSGQQASLSKGLCQWYGPQHRCAHVVVANRVEHEIVVYCRFCYRTLGSMRSMTIAVMQLHHIMLISPSKLAADASTTRLFRRLTTSIRYMKLCLLSFPCCYAAFPQYVLVTPKTLPMAHFHVAQAACRAPLARQPVQQATAVHPQLPASKMEPG